MKILLVVWNFYPNAAYTNHTKVIVRDFGEFELPDWNMKTEEMLELPVLSKRGRKYSKIFVRKEVRLCA